MAGVREWNEEMSVTSLQAVFGLCVGRPPSPKACWSFWPLLFIILIANIPISSSRLHLFSWKSTDRHSYHDVSLGKAPSRGSQSYSLRCTAILFKHGAYRHTTERCGWPDHTIRILSGDHPAFKQFNFFECSFADWTWRKLDNTAIRSILFHSSSTAHTARRALGHCGGAKAPWSLGKSIFRQ